MSKTKKTLGSGTMLTRTDVLEKALVALVGQQKGGSGKTFCATTFIDLLGTRGLTPRIVQVDDQHRLDALFPGRVTTVSGASLEDMRRDPGQIVQAFDPLYTAVEQTITDRIPLVVDVGSLNQTILEDYLALIDADEDLVAASVDTFWFVPATAEPESMRGAIRTVETIGRVLPSVRRLVVLNMRDGPFRFYPGSPADILWRTGLEPLCRELGTIELPAISPGSWSPFEATGQRFVDVVGAEIAQIQAWTGRSRPAAKVLRGDVAQYLAAADLAFGPLLDTVVGAGE